MQAYKSPQNILSYLDVSQFIIKETSPLIKPSSPQQQPHLEVTPLYFMCILLSNWLIFLMKSRISRTNAYSFSFFFLIIQSYRMYHTPEIQPIDQDTSQFLLTPLNKYTKLQEMSDFVDDFSLDSAQTNFSQRKRQGLKNKVPKRREIQNSACQFFLLECDLEKIVEDDEQLNIESEQCDQDSEISQDQSQAGKNLQEIKMAQGSWTHKLKSQDTNLRDTQEQKVTIFQLSPIDYSDKIGKFIKNPKSEIFKAIKQIASQKQIGSEEQKILALKKYLEQYLLQFETFYHQEAWSKLTGDFKSITELISQEIQQMFSKKIGPINFQQRRVKLLKYLEKKKRRIWRKKVSYDCRKKVADGRLRIKGKFVTREQACQRLCFENLDHYSPQQIKQMLQRRMDSLERRYSC